MRLYRKRPFVPCRVFGVLGVVAPQRGKRDVRTFQPLGPLPPVMRQLGVHVRQRLLGVLPAQEKLQDAILRLVIEYPRDLETLLVTSEEMQRLWQQE